MRRRIGQVVLFVLLGAILNVAMAWGAVLAFNRESLDQNLLSELGHEFQLTVARALANQDVRQPPSPSLACRGVWRDVIVSKTLAREPEAIVATIYTHECGFPFRALKGAHTKCDNYGVVDYMSHGAPRQPITTTRNTTSIALHQQIELCQGRDNYALDTTQKVAAASSNLARLRDQHDLLRGSPLAAVCISIRAAAQAADRARAVSCVCVSGRRERRLH